jgi:glyoxylase-like metal-dependent hydrolase (beta-lactamase superfamily II)
MESTEGLTFGPVTVYPGTQNGKYPDGNQVVVRGRDAMALFDTPLSALRRLDRLNGADLIILGHVHEDHVCALGNLPDVPVFAPEADLPALQSLDGLMAHYGYSAAATEAMRHHVVEDFHFAPRPDAQGYIDGRTWDLGGVTVRAFHMPGHTRGHSVLFVEPGGIAFIGDIDLSGFGPYYGDACSNLEQFVLTLERVRRLEARVWITSHHKGVVTGRAEFEHLLSRFRDRVWERERAICSALADGGRTLDELVARRFLYPPGFHGIFVDDAERQTLREHLNLLMRDGRVLEEQGRYRIASPA